MENQKITKKKKKGVNWDKNNIELTQSILMSCFFFFFFFFFVSKPRNLSLVYNWEGKRMGGVHSAKHSAQLERRGEWEKM